MAVQSLAAETTATPAPEPDEPDEPDNRREFSDESDEDDVDIDSLAGLTEEEREAKRRQRQCRERRRKKRLIKEAEAAREEKLVEAINLEMKYGCTGFLSKSTRKTIKKQVLSFYASYDEDFTAERYRREGPDGKHGKYHVLSHVPEAHVMQMPQKHLTLLILLYGLVHNFENLAQKDRGDQHHSKSKHGRRASAALARSLAPAALASSALVGVGAACHQQLDYGMLAMHGGKVQGRVTVLTARADIEAKVQKCTACVC